MLVDSGAIVNLMPYPLYKKLDCTDDELIKTNMTITVLEEVSPSWLEELLTWSSPLEARLWPRHSSSLTCKVAIT
jgi:hypothetical protein